MTFLFRLFYSVLSVVLGFQVTSGSNARAGQSYCDLFLIGPEQAEVLEGTDEDEIINRVMHAVVGALVEGKSLTAIEKVSRNLGLGDDLVDQFGNWLHEPGMMEKIDRVISSGFPTPPSVLVETLVDSLRRDAYPLVDMGDQWTAFGMILRDQPERESDTRLRDSMDRLQGLVQSMSLDHPTLRPEAGYVYVRQVRVASSAVEKVIERTQADLSVLWKVSDPVDAWDRARRISERVHYGLFLIDLATPPEVADRLADLMPDLELQRKTLLNLAVRGELLRRNRPDFHPRRPRYAWEAVEWFLQGWTDAYRLSFVQERFRQGELPSELMMKPFSDGGETFELLAMSLADLIAESRSPFHHSSGFLVSPLQFQLHDGLMVADIEEFFQGNLEDLKGISLIQWQKVAAHFDFVGLQMHLLEDRVLAPLIRAGGQLNQLDQGRFRMIIENISRLMIATILFRNQDLHPSLYALTWADFSEIDGVSIGDLIEEEGAKARIPLSVIEEFQLLWEKIVQLRLKREF